MAATNFQSSGLQQQVDHLMDILWSGGVNNPMDSIEQLSYLIFLRLLSERDEQLAALAMMVVDDPDARAKFLQDDPTLFMAGQFTQMGGVSALTRFTERASVFEALRQSSLVRQAVTGGLAV